ncbi:hypothetical protein M758_6G022200 [Ceratodon purpureus]|nr:hypothetical protein M758_6G022200 [Ceratodon purpureus]
MASVCSDHGGEDAQCGLHTRTGSAHSFENNERSKLYENMAAELGKQGPVFLGGGETSQSLKLSDLFSVVEGKIVPIHKAANPPVRAVVLYLDPDAAHEISRTVKSVLSPHFSKTGVWYQDPDFYHFSMHHASHHQNPVPATPEEVEIEAASVKNVADRSWLLEIELERVVLTPSGVLLGCWQVSKGTDPSLLRKELRTALPRSPATQVYNPTIFYTSFARLLSPPLTTRKDESMEAVLEMFKELVVELNLKLCSKTTVEELWYVEELDILALALKGRTRIRRFRLKPQPPHPEG